jgi:hypothetical protein
MFSKSYKQFLLEIFGGVVAGYITETLTQSLSWMLNKRGLPHIVYLVLILVLVIEFVSGIKKVYAFGAVYFISLIFFGVVMGELDSVIVGGISIITFISGIYLRSGD